MVMEVVVGILMGILRRMEMEMVMMGTGAMMKMMMEMMMMEMMMGTGVMMDQTLRLVNVQYNKGFMDSNP